MKPRGRRYRARHPLGRSEGVPIGIAWDCRSLLLLAMLLHGVAGAGDGDPAMGFSASSVQHTGNMVDVRIIIKLSVTELMSCVF